MMFPSTRSGFVAIIGEPNAGKSTFLNSVLKQKLAIVTPKPQTTRKQIVGIYTEENDFQIAFWDTPGILKPRYLLHQEILKPLNQTIFGADAILFFIDIEKSLTKNENINSNLAFEKIRNVKIPVILVLNKIDLVKKDQVLEKINHFASAFSFKDIVPVSSTKRENVMSVIKILSTLMPISPFLYDPKDISTAPERFFISELIREKIFKQYYQEVPYSIEVILDEYGKCSNGKTLIRASIIVEKEAQKSIIIGKSGSAIKELGISSRNSIENFLDKNIYLKLFVKVRKNWRKNKILLKSFGY